MLSADKRFGTGGRFAGWIFARGFHKILDRLDRGLEMGTIEGHLPDGTVRVLGGRNPGPFAHINLRSWSGLLRLIRSGSVGWYRAWELGEWDSPDLPPVFEIFSVNRSSLRDFGRASGLFRIIAKIRHVLRRNDKGRARENIHYHYDLGNDFYAAWLDETMSYSSAVFDALDANQETLAAAQKQKLDSIFGRLQPQSGQSFLEIGCGWGYLCGTAATQYGLDATGISLSEEQTAWAAAHHPAATFQIRDYRDEAGQYDLIASVEMVEAVGQEYWPDFLDSITQNLKPGGRAALQYISIADDIFGPYAASADFIQTYIFPGGMLLSESRFRALAEQRGLIWQDQEDFGLDYAHTLRIWRERFDDAVEEGRLPAGFDSSFVNLWRYYLAYCEGGFRAGGINVSQVTLIKNK